MKKLLIGLVIIFLAAGTVYAAGRTDTQDITIDLQITGDFGMAFPYGTDIDLGSGLPGAPVDGQTSGLTIVASSQYAEAWDMSVQSTAFVGVTPANTFTGEDAAIREYLGLEYFLPQGKTSKGVSTYANPPASPPYKAIPTTAAALFYTPNAGTYNEVHDVGIAVGPSLPNVPPDSYSATMTVTMAEN